MRLVLAASARFPAVDEHLRRCGLELDEVEPQVFPARPEPARAWWIGPGAAAVAVFRYHVNPDRRTLDLDGAEASAIAATVRASLGTIPFEQIAGRLADGDPESAFVAAFVAASSGDDRALDVLSRALRERDDYVGVGCLRAIELLGDAAAVPLLREIRRDEGRAGEVRLLAGEIAGALSSGADLH